MNDANMGPAEALGILGWAERDRVPPTVRDKASRVLFENLSFIANHKRRGLLTSYEFIDDSDDCIQMVVDLFLSRQAPLRGSPPPTDAAALAYLRRCLTNVFLNRRRIAAGERRKQMAMRAEVVPPRSRARTVSELLEQQRQREAEENQVRIFRTPASPEDGVLSLPELDPTWSGDDVPDTEPDEATPEEEDRFPWSSDEFSSSRSDETDDTGALLPVLERFRDFLLRHASMRLEDEEFESLRRDVLRFQQVVLETAQGLRSESVRRVFTETCIRLLRCALGETTIDEEISSILRHGSGEVTGEVEAQRKQLRARLDQQHHRALERIHERCLASGMDPSMARRFVASLSLRGYGERQRREVSDTGNLPAS